MYQAVRDADGCFAIALSTLLIAAQYAVITDVFSALMRLSQGFRKAHDISHTEVKPLPGNRVQSCAALPTSTVRWVIALAARVNASG